MRCVTHTRTHKRFVMKNEEQTKKRDEYEHEVNPEEEKNNLREGLRWRDKKKKKRKEKRAAGWRLKAKQLRQTEGLMDERINRWMEEGRDEVREV